MPDTHLYFRCLQFKNIKNYFSSLSSPNLNKSDPVAAEGRIFLYLIQNPVASGKMPAAQYQWVATSNPKLEARNAQRATRNS